MGEEAGSGGRYRFSLKKRYSFERKYRKVEVPVGEMVKAKLLSALGRKPVQEEPKKKAPGLAPEEEKKEEKPLLQMAPIAMFRIGGLFGLLLLLALTAFLFAQTISFPSEVWTSEASSAYLSAHVAGSDIITLSDAENLRYPYRAAYSSLGLASSGVRNITVNAQVYDSPPPNSVFVLRSNRFQAETYPVFLSSLSSSLGEYGLGANEISIRELDNLGSGSFLVIPSGYVPEELITGDRPLLFSLLERGVTVVYVGQDFSRMLSKTGSVVSAPQLPTRLRISFTPSPVSSEPPFLLRNGLYSASGLDNTYRFGGSYSVLAYRSGFFILAPQTLDGGWDSPENAASDISIIFLRSYWLTPKAGASLPVQLTGNDNVELFTSRFEGNSAYLKLSGYNAESRAGFYDSFRISKSTRGEIYLRGGHMVPPGTIAPSTTDLFISLREIGGGESFIFISITNLSGELDRFSTGSSRSGLNSDFSIIHEFSLAPGDYILNAVDQEGRTYARSYLRVKRPGLSPTSINTGSDVYSFTVTGDGSPMSVPSATATVDGGQYGTYPFTNTAYLLINVKEGHGPMPDGSHIFNFTIGGFRPAYAINKTSPTPFFMQPQILGAIFIALLVLAVGVFFKAGEKPVFRLDIPDFPPQSTEKVSLSKETLLGLLDKVNQKYRWKNTPLKLAEIKGAFKEIIHQGKPLFISDYNLEYLLDQLVGQGLLRKEAGYYSNAEWEGESGFSAKSLSMFRSLRDICVNEAIPFTQLGSSQEYDSKVTILGQDMFVHFYSGPRVVGKVFGALHNGLNIIITEDEGEVEELNEFLSSGLDAATRLKLEIQSGSVQVRSLGGLRQMIKDMKV